MPDDTARVKNDNNMASIAVLTQSYGKITIAEIRIAVKTTLAI